ncbi:P-loop NTPase fold protein [Streptomyces sp. NPDC020490]|uniref:P-loop NTPase fold protein n=1 Tax=Streptomyces sp. NPDC020490 TaxID=3365078 RepID=UPI0037A3FAB3
MTVPVVAPSEDGIPWLDPQPGGVGALVSWHEPGGAIRLASAGADRTVRVWDLRSGTPLGSPLIGHTACVGALTRWTEDTGAVRLASSGEDHTVWIWDPARGTAVAGPLTGHTEWVMGLTSWTAPDGSVRLASASADRTVRLWDARTGEPIGQPLVAGSGGLWAVAVLRLPDGTVRLAAGGDGGAVHLWDAETGEPSGEISQACPTGVYSLTAWKNADGSARLAVGGMDGTVQIWDAEGRSVCEPMTGHTAAVRAIAVWTTPDGRTLLASAAADGTVRIWDAATGSAGGEPFTGHLGWMPAVTAWSDEHGVARLATAGDGGTIRLWDPETGDDVKQPLTGHVAGQWALTSWTCADGAVRLASAGDDAVIRVWDPESGTPAGPPLVGHTAGIWALTSWTRSDGRSRLASAGDDGTVRVWDPDTGAALHAPLPGQAAWLPALASWQDSDGEWHLASGGTDGVVRVWNPETGTLLREWPSGAPWVLALAAWSVDGVPRLASAGDDGQVRVWDPGTGAAVGAPMAGHTAWARALAVWTTSHGRPALASAGFDAMVRTWDPQTGAAMGGALTGHTARIGALTSWRGPDGGIRLASGSDDNTIRLWEPRTGTTHGEPLIGHTSGVWALTSWTTPSGDARIASAGYDGTVRLWNPWTGEAVRTIETGPVTLWGMSDAPARTDLLGRGALAEALAHQAFRSVDAAKDDAGPTVISIEGPWGSGKSSLMSMVRALAPSPTRPAGTPPDRPMTAREAIRLIRRHGRPRPSPRADTDRAGIVTAWFNPWFYQSGQQVWAGLTSEIIEAVAPVLYPGDSERERYWLTRNLERVDRFALRRLLLRRTVSPLLGIGFVAVLLPFLLGLAALDGPVNVLGTAWPAVGLSLVVAVAFVLVALTHTLIRYCFGRASRFIPGTMLRLPILDGSDPADVLDGAGQAADPLRRATAGSLYLLQHDIGRLLADLAATGNELVVFVDDLDRCRSDTAAEVFEAVNLFLSGVATGHGLRARFILGLDPSVVATHLDAYTEATSADPGVYAQDPSPGWAFLRKLVQLPVVLPQVSEQGVAKFVEAVTHLPPARSAPATTIAPHAPNVTAGRADAVVPTAPGSGATATTARGTGTVRRPARTSVLAVRTLEQHPRIQQLLMERIAALEEPSIREAKRMLNVWQLYERALMVDEPLARSEAAVERACLLVHVAEIVVRWPALQRRLHRRVDGSRGLGLLAAAAEEDDLWAAGVRRLGLDQPPLAPALNGLRHMLREHDGVAIARLASRVL